MSRFHEALPYYSDCMTWRQSTSVVADRRRAQRGGSNVTKDASKLMRRTVRNAVAFSVGTTQILCKIIH